MLKIAEYAQKVEQLKEKTQKVLSLIDSEVLIDNKKIEKVRLVFVGQYSAGKSSILKMLTGREDIAIGAKITTQQAHIYQWNGIEVVDTPGIHTSLRPDHDEISYQAIAMADMLVFVVSNELFDSYMADHFRKLAIDKDKASEMILVVNKMDRTTAGNTPEQQNVICEDLRKVIDPYTPEQLNLSFLDAESFLDGKKEEDDDPELAEELISRSGYYEFVEKLNRFIEEKSITSKLTTQLYVIDDILEKEIKKLQPNSDDEDIDALEENLLQQRHVLVEVRGEIQQEVVEIYNEAVCQIRNIGLDSANILVEGCKKEEVEGELQLSIKKAEDIIDKCQNDADLVMENRLNEMGQQLERIENSEFSKKLKARLVGKFEGLPDGIKKMLATTGKGLKDAGSTVLKNAYNVSAEGGLKLTNFSGSGIHKMVLKVGEKINFKFKPWQAVKITKGIAIGGQVLNVLGVGISIFMQIKEDKDEEDIREDLKHNRQNIRSQFNTAASELEDYSREYIKDNIKVPLDKSILAIDQNIQEIRNTRQSRSDNCIRLEDLQNECRNLIQDIHQGED